MCNRLFRTYYNAWISMCSRCDALHEYINNFTQACLLILMCSTLLDFVCLTVDTSCIGWMNVVDILFNSSFCEYFLQTDCIFWILKEFRVKKLHNSVPLCLIYLRLNNMCIYTIIMIQHLLNYSLLLNAGLSSSHESHQLLSTNCSIV